MLTKGMWSEIEQHYAGRVRLAVFDFTDEATTAATRSEAERLGLGAVLEEAGFATGTILVLDGRTQGNPRVDQRQPRLRRVSSGHRRRARSPAEGPR